MAILKKFGRKNKEPEQKQDIPPPPTAVQEEGIEATADVFEYSDNEKERVEEWWLQKGVEEEIEEEPEPEELLDEDEQQEEGEKSGDGDDLIYSLREEEEEEDDMGTVLRSVIEELGDTTAEELLEFGRTTLREIGGENIEEGED